MMLRLPRSRTQRMRARSMLVPILLGLATLSPVAFAQSLSQPRPTVTTPKGVTTFDIGQQVNINGLPMRMTGFVSAVDPQEVAERFRTSLGKPLVENIVAGKLVLARMEGNFFISVQIEQAGAGARGVIAITDLKAAADNKENAKDKSQRWLAAFPSGSRLVSNMESQDAGKLSRHLVVSNTHDESLNRERLIGVMRDQGLALEREAAADPHPGSGMSATIDNGRVLFFKGSGKDAMATISRDRDRQTTIVLNIVTELEALR